MQSLILCGYKACGKTTLGKRVAQRLGLQFIDLDDIIVTRYRAENGSSTPQTCREIYALHGSKKFRALEKAALRSLMPSCLLVLATGGGVVLDPDNVQNLKALGLLVYLKVRSEILFKRLSTGPVPATLDPSNLEASFFTSYAEREPIYSAVADVIVEAADRPEEQVIEELAALARG